MQPAVVVTAHQGERRQQPFQNGQRRRLPDARDGAAGDQRDDRKADVAAGDFGVAAFRAAARLPWPRVGAARGDDLRRLGDGVFGGHGWRSYLF